MHSTSTILPDFRRRFSAGRHLPATGGLLALVMLTAIAISRGETPEEIFDRKLADGYEPAVPLEGSSSADGRLSMIVTARKKNLKPADWPSIIPDVSVNGTSVMDEGGAHVLENWIVDLQAKKRLGVVSSDEETYQPHYAGKNNTYFETFWGPEQEGWHFGVLNYTGRWGCNDIFFVNCDGEKARVTSMRKLLHKNATKLITARKKDPAVYEIGYTLLGAENPETSVTVSDPLTLRLTFTAQIPKSDEDLVEGTITLKLSRDEKGISTASVLSVKPGIE